MWYINRVLSIFTAANLHFHSCYEFFFFDIRGKLKPADNLCEKVVLCVYTTLNWNSLLKCLAILLFNQLCIHKKFANRFCGGLYWYQCLPSWIRLLLGEQVFCWNPYKPQLLFVLKRESSLRVKIYEQIWHLINILRQIHMHFFNLYFFARTPCHTFIFRLSCSFFRLWLIWPNLRKHPYRLTVEDIIAVKEVIDVNPQLIWFDSRLIARLATTDHVLRPYIPHKM